MKHKPKEEEKKCEVTGCSEMSKRSIPRKKVMKATSLNLAGEGKNVHLCKEHYRTFKKATKDEREMDRLSWG